MVDRIGQQLGNYRLVKMLGQGGYAKVYLGQHMRFKQQAAIKVLHAHLSEQEAQHFQQEAETIATLAHPGIIRVLDFDVQDGVPFLVIDYAPGGTLRRRYPKGNLVPLPDIVSCVKQAADALQYAHEQKFIHRDVKPENMLLGRRQEVLLSDFGIATIAHSTSSLNVGSEGATGTLAYMAPEQIEGHPRAASDQYALAIVVYEWVCGERPFEGSASEVMAQQLSVPPLPLRERVPAISVEVEHVVSRALSKDPKARFASVADFATALEQADQRVLTPTAQITNEQPAFGWVDAKGYETVLVEPARSKRHMESTPSADLKIKALEPMMPSDDTPQNGATSETPKLSQIVAPTAAVVSPPLEPTMPVRQLPGRVSRTLLGTLIGLAVLVVAGGILGNLSLLAHFGVIGSLSPATTISPARGGTWTDGIPFVPFSLIPSGQSDLSSDEMDQALYLPLFYGDSKGLIYPGAASEVPTVQNDGVSADATTWTFHLRPHLVWSDGRPYDARDVDYSWQLWRNPKFGGSSNFHPGLNLISSTDMSADYLTIRFHLKQAYAAFLSLWVDGQSAPLPAHRFSSMAPEQVLKSPDNLNPTVTSGPFLMGESAPEDHYTLIRNPGYYRASEGLPYLDKIVFRVVDENSLSQDFLQDLRAGTITSSYFLNVSNALEDQHLSNYTLVTLPTSASFEGLFFNFHNMILVNHLEVRQAISMAIDQQALIHVARNGFASPQCTDHGSFYSPGYGSSALCPLYSPVDANKLLDNNGWVIGADGVRTKGKERLEFEYSTSVTPYSSRTADEEIIQRDLQVIGIKLQIQNYSPDQLFNHILPEGKASPPSGAVENRYDIAEFANSFGYDPDDSSLLSCNQIPPQGYNFDFYCNHALDALYTQEQATVDPSIRQQIFNNIHDIYLTALPFIVLYSPLDVGIVRKGTHNYQPSPIEGDTVNIWEWWCDKGKC
jgi:ABC-type transport system substrate-binding protein/tRNA A-37 threonylcarbamoyl transferase component Bud32